MLLILLLFCLDFHTAVLCEGTALLSAKHKAKTAPKRLVWVSCISAKLPKPHFCSFFSYLCPGSPTGSSTSAMVKDGSEKNGQK